MIRDHCDFMDVVMRMQIVWNRVALIAIVLLTLGVPPLYADDTENDPEFGGQILTLTEPKKLDIQSDDPRFQDNKNGTVTDLQENLTWQQLDSYQTLKKWLNWHDAQKYITKLNAEKFGNATDWRLPTRKELSTLFEESKSIPWNYYWTKNEVHIDPIFGNSHCCYWTSEPNGKEMAWGFNYIRGKPYVSMKGGIQKSLSVIRAVRDADRPEESAEK